MDNSLIKQTDIKAVSFSGNTRSTPQIQLVIKLLKYSIEANKPTTMEDIINTYIDWRVAHSRNPLTKDIYIGNKGGHWSENYARVIIEREEYAKMHSSKMLARAWFKGNLASAIIRGKLLVIPVIDIE